MTAPNDVVSTPEATDNVSPVEVIPSTDVVTPPATDTLPPVSENTSTGNTEDTPIVSEADFSEADMEATLDSIIS